MTASIFSEKNTEIIKNPKKTKGKHEFEHWHSEMLGWTGRLWSVRMDFWMEFGDFGLKR